jgi:hypothetical protein
VWFAWYVQEPRLWDFHDGTEKRKKSDAKLLVAFMKLFLDQGFVLDPRSSSYRDDVFVVCKAAEARIITFLRGHDIKARGSNAILKYLRAQHKGGQLNDMIKRYRTLRIGGKIADHAPDYTQDVLEMVTPPTRR